MPVLRIAALILTGTIAAATANEMRSPRISGVTVDWLAAAAHVAMPAAIVPETVTGETGTAENDSGPPSEKGTETAQAPAATEAINTPVAAPVLPLPVVPVEPVARLNDASTKVIPTITASPIPVLLPVDTAALQRDRATGSLRPLADYLGSFRTMAFFQAGPGGYDAVFALYPDDRPEVGIRFSGRIDIHISGSALLYELDEPKGLIGWPASGLAADFPGIRRLYLEGIVRYTFVRFEVPYVVSILCNDGRASHRKVACRDADKVAAQFLRALQVAGGTPQTRAIPAASQEPPAPDKPVAVHEPHRIDVDTIARPAAVSDVFTYYRPGDLIPGSGSKGQGGRADYTVYTKMRFPIADPPAFANSQSFMNWGDCDQTGRVMMGRRGATPAYRCRVNDQMLIADEAAADNYAYPWRDNFCEHRYFGVGECPAGLGHQGQDIRPSSCARRAPGADRCEPYQHDVVAVRDGIVIRSPDQMAFYVVTNGPNERIRFRYLHMSPKQLDENGILNGRVVREGEVIGKVGNYFKRERGTTYHLHFDMQVPTRYGWVFVNPYMTLVAAYERQIGARGRELRDTRGIEEISAPQAMPQPQAAQEPGLQEPGLQEPGLHGPAVKEPEASEAAPSTAGPAVASHAAGTTAPAAVPPLP